MTDSPESRTVASTVSFAALLQKGVERIADFQKIALDLCAHQTASLCDTWKRYSLPGTSYPGTCLADFAGQGICQFIEMQKNLLDLLVEQSMRGIEAIRPVEASLTHAAVLADEPTDASMDRLITEQEEQAAIAMVDKIEAMVAQAPPIVVLDAAVQQQKPTAKVAHAVPGRPNVKRESKHKTL